MKKLSILIVLIMLTGCNKPLDPATKLACSELNLIYSQYLHSIQNVDGKSDELLKTLEDEWDAVKPSIPERSEKMLMGNSIIFQKFLRRSLYPADQETEARAELDLLYDELNPKYIKTLQKKASKRDYPEPALLLLKDLQTNPYAIGEAPYSFEGLPVIFRLNVETGMRALIELVMEE